MTGSRSSGSTTRLSPFAMDAAFSAAAAAATEASTVLMATPEAFALASTSAIPSSPGSSPGKRAHFASQSGDALIDTSQTLFVPLPAEELEAINHTRYERTLKSELTKVEKAITDERVIKQSIKAEIEAQEQLERQKKKWDEERAKKLKAMEQAIVYAGKKNTERFLKKRAALTKRIQEKDAQAERQREEATRQRQEQLAQVAAEHDNRINKLADERSQADEKMRLADESRQAKLRAKLLADREALQEKNERKADEAARKVQQAADLRTEMAEKQRARFQEREIAQRNRMLAQKEAQEKRLADIRAAADMKRQGIERAQQVQRSQEQQRRTLIMEEAAARQQQLEEWHASDEAARRQRAYEDRLQAAAMRNNVEDTMQAALQHAAEREFQMEERMAKVDNLQLGRQMDTERAQHLSVRLSVDRAQLANSMGKLRTNLSSSDPNLIIDLPKQRRRKVKDQDVKTILDRVDPKAEGHIHLPSVKKKLAKMLPPPRPISRATHLPVSKSMPSLLPPKPDMSLHDKCVEAFKAADIDGSGTISKRELLTTLRSMGLKDTKNAMDLFNSFDADGSMQLDFDEFEHIAKKLLVS